MGWLKDHLRRRRYIKKGGLFSTNGNEATQHKKTAISHQPMNRDIGVKKEPNPFPILPTISSESDRGLSNDCGRNIPEDIGPETLSKTDIQPTIDWPMAPLSGKAESQLPVYEKIRKLPDVLQSEENGTPGDGRSNHSVKGIDSDTPGNAVMNTSKNEDIDGTTSYSQAVTHETIHPHVHEIKEEQIRREIHTHDVYHRVQPVYDIEVLPARHFVLGSNGALVEASENELPTCTGSNQRWYIGETSPPVVSSSMDQQHRPVKRIE